MSDEPTVRVVWGPPCCHAKQEVPPLGTSTLSCQCGIVWRIERKHGVIEIQDISAKKKDTTK